MKTPQQITSELNQFYGSATLCKHWLGLKYTEGIQYLAQEANCYWLLAEGATIPAKTWIL